jgi:tetratricopeptide (TPR) repeat protein
MTGPATPSTPYIHRDFFISRAGPDKALAIWIGQLIAAQGKTYVLQDADFGHQDFMGAMDSALKSGARVVALYSLAYLNSDNCLKEALTALHGDPFNRQQRLIPMRIEPCAPDGMLRGIVYADLLAERRQADGSALTVKILAALGFTSPILDGLPPPPEGTVARVRIMHPEIANKRTDLAPRPDLLARLSAAMKKRVAALTNSNQVMGALAGMGGVGKTVLARTYAWEHQDAYHGVWWIDAERRGDMLAGLASLGAEMSSAIKAETNVELAARATLKLIEDSGTAKPFLLVYDNVEKPGDLELWTPRKGAHVLLTTRWLNWDPMVGTVDVGMLDREAAIEFLCGRTGRLDDREEAGLLADELGCLPLALDHAASYCRGPPRLCFQKYREKLGQQFAKKPPKGGILGEYRYSVRDTFNLALARVIKGDRTAGVRACPGAKIVMGVAAMLAPEAIPVFLFEHAQLASADVDTALRALAVVSLITARDERGETTIAVHRVVQFVMRERLKRSGATAKLAELAMTLILAKVPDSPSQYENWTKCATLVPHATIVLNRQGCQDRGGRHEALLSVFVGQYLLGRFETLAALPYLKRALELHKAIDGDNSKEVGIVITNLGAACVSLAEFEEAEAIFRRNLAIAIDRRDSQATAEALAHLACAVELQGRYSEAEQLLIRALSIFQEVVEPDHRGTAWIQYELAIVHEAQGRYGEAEALLRRAFAMHEKLFGLDSLNTATVLHELGELYLSRGLFSDAEPLLKQSLAIYERTVGPDHPITSRGHREWANLALGKCRIEEARAALANAIAIEQRFVEPDHLRFSHLYDTLSLIALAEGNALEAENAARKALSVRRAKLSDGHPAIAQSRWTLARVLLARGQQITEAKLLLDQSIAALEPRVTPEHVWLKGARATLAELAVREAAVLPSAAGEVPTAS